MSQETQNHLEKVAASCFIEQAEICSTTDDNRFIIHIKPDKAFAGNPIKVNIPITTFNNFHKFTKQEQADFEIKLTNYINHQMSKPVIWNIEI